MHFFVDQDVYYLTVLLLREWKHDVITASELGMKRSRDEELLRKAKEMKRIFVTRDKDFGALVFLKDIDSGVILLRMTPTTVDEVHKELKSLLEMHDEVELQKLFSVVEPNRYRLRKINLE